MGDLLAALRVVVLALAIAVPGFAQDTVQPKPLQLGEKEHIALLKLANLRQMKLAELETAKRAAEAIPRLEREVQELNERLNQWIAKHSPCERGSVDLDGKWDCEIAPGSAGTAPPAQ